MQKNRHLRTIAQLCRAISSQLRHVSTIGQKLVKQQYLPHMSLQYGELWPLAAEIVSLVWGTPANFNGFRVLAALLHSQTAALNRGHQLYSARRPSRWALAHISSIHVDVFVTSTVTISGARCCFDHWFSLCPCSTPTYVDTSVTIHDDDIKNSDRCVHVRRNDNKNTSDTIDFRHIVRVRHVETIDNHHD